jgi:hypothetical protein
MEALHPVVVAAFTQLMLAAEALGTLAEMGRATWRTWISRVELLEWAHRSPTMRSSSPNVGAYLREMWPSIAVSAIATALVVGAKAETVFIAVPFLVAWAAAPWLTMLLDRHVLQSDDASRQAPRMDGHSLLGERAPGAREPAVNA